MNVTKTLPLHPRPTWLSKEQVPEDNLCPDCFRVVGVRSRYKLVCILGKNKLGASVTELTAVLGLKQPTVTHHLNILKSVGAVQVAEKGRERIYTLDRSAHCFEECKIPFV